MSAGEIAKGLTKAQREQVIRMADVWRLPDLRVTPSLVAKGLVRQCGKKYGHELTPLGLAVRAHLQENPGHE